MSVPPQNPYGGPPPGGGPAWGGPGGPQPGFGGPGGPGGPPQWGGPPPQWGPPPGPPPGRGGRGKWILGGLALLVVIALSVTVTVSVLRPDSGGDDSPIPTNGPSEFASADDVGPVNIITEDPTCAALNRIVSTVGNEEKRVNWAGRDRANPASGWTPEERSMYEAVAAAMNNAAVQVTELARQTPHRVMRELYTQFFAYSAEFQQSLQTFSGGDQYVPEEVDRIASALVDICASISSDIAAAQAPFVPDGETPAEVRPPSDPSSTATFISTIDPICKEWSDIFSRFDADTSDWRTIDSDIPAAQWTPQQRAANDNVASIMTKYADDLERLGRSSSNPVLQDFAVLAAQYRRAYVQALPTYSPVDNYLANASTELVRVINSGCKALE